VLAQFDRGSQLTQFTWRTKEEVGENHLDEHEEKEVVRIIGGWNV
jgi:hypothetical protein